MTHEQQIKQYFQDNGFVQGEIFRVEGYRQATRGLKKTQGYSHGGGYLWWEVSSDWRAIDPATTVIDVSIEQALINGAVPVRYTRRGEGGELEPLSQSE